MSKKEGEESTGTIMFIVNLVVMFLLFKYMVEYYKIEQTVTSFTIEGILCTIVTMLACFLELFIYDKIKGDNN